jgi:hypothetical protein
MVFRIDDYEKLILLPLSVPMYVLIDGYMDGFAPRQQLNG